VIAAEPGDHWLGQRCARLVQRHRVRQHRRRRGHGLACAGLRRRPCTWALGRQGRPEEGAGAGGEDERPTVVPPAREPEDRPVPATGESCVRALGRAPLQALCGLDPLHLGLRCCSSELSFRYRCRPVSGSTPAYTLAQAAGRELLELSARTSTPGRHGMRMATFIPPFIPHGVVVIDVLGLLVHVFAPAPDRTAF
jgi:hypothetical protein